MPLSNVLMSPIGAEVIWMTGNYLLRNLEWLEIKDQDKIT